MFTVKYFLYLVAFLLGPPLLPCRKPKSRRSNQYSPRSDRSIQEPLEKPYKPDVSVCFCIDCHRLNQVSPFDAYPMPRLDTHMHKVGGFHGGGKVWAV